MAVWWINLAKINVKAILLSAMAALLSILVASSLPHSGLSDAIANESSVRAVKYFRSLPLISISNITFSIE